MLGAHAISGRISLAIAILALIAIRPVASSGAPLEFTGVNLSGAEFGVSNNNVNLPDVYGTNYTYPTAGEVNYYVGKGMNTFRLPFRWERLQRTLNGALDPNELGRMDTFVNAATAKGAYTIIDPHNFERYNPAPSNFQSSAQGLVGSDVPDSAFADFWSRIANQYKSNSHVIFNLMNEPNTVPESQLVASENAAIAAIRATGATNLILVPGNDYTGAWTWVGGQNDAGMLGIVDPGNNYAYDVHQYLDGNGSGTSTQIGTNQNPNDPNIGATRLTAFTQWLHDHGRKAFLGEFAVANTTIGTGATKVGDEAINNMLTLMEKNSDVWLGWNWWGGGPWWGSYMFTIEPSSIDQPVLGALQATGDMQTQPHIAHSFTGDYDNNGVVDANDYAAWQGSFGQTGAGLPADGNVDGIVDAADYTIWRDHANLGGAGSLAGGAVPEPATFGLGVFSAAALVLMWGGRLFRCRV